MPLIREFECKENILVFDPHIDPSRSAYSSQLLQDQEKQESKHFWFRTRRDKICHFFHQNVGENEKILEIGGGTGFIAERLMKFGFSLEMADIHFNGLKYAQQKGIEKLYQFDLYTPPFQNEFDAICLFDVLEHQKDDKLAIESLKKMLKPHGKILLTVPAHPWLWNRDDRINGHYRRYNKKDLFDLCKKCNLKPIRAEYFFIFILPLLYLRTWRYPDRGQEVATDEKLKFDLPSEINWACEALTKLEFFLARWLPNVLGGSLFLLAEKNDD